jgi:type VI secretion system protein ImpC
MRIDFTFGPSPSPRPPRRHDDGTPGRILVLTDLLGHSEEPARILDRSVVRVDGDNVEDMLARYAPSVVLGPGAGGERLRFRAFEDFHPDSLVGRLSLFRRLLDVRRRLEQPDTFPAALAELGAEAPRGATADVETVRQAPDESGSMFERLLGQKGGPSPAAGPPPNAPGAIDSLIRGIVAPYVVVAKDSRLPALLSAVDVALGDVMRRVLHDPAFQGVEATWRGIQWLVSSLELGEDLELYLLHVTRDEIVQGAGPGSQFYRRLVDREAQTAGGLRLSAIIGLYRFGASAEDLAVLESLGALARAADAPFVAECGASLLGSSAVAQQPDPREWNALDPEIDARWRALRAGPAGAWVGLALPRILLRLPYGDKSDRIETFQFEEMAPAPDHESFLWGNAALACAAVIGRLLQAGGEAGDPGDIADLPAFAFTADEEPRLQPCAEVCLSEPAVEAILARGVMPLVSFKDRNAVRLVRLQSIADPPSVLIG